MTALSADACRQLLDAALAGSVPLEPTVLASLATVPADALDDGLRSFATEHGAAALTVLTTLASERADRSVRRAAKRALYRLAQRGVAPPPKPAPRPIVEREAERATRAWLSGIDGTGSRVAWVLVQGGPRPTTLCSLILNDGVGIVDADGGEISKKRLEAELASLRAAEKLTWVETGPEHVARLVTEALALHRELGTAPPPTFAPWERLFQGSASPNRIEGPDGNGPGGAEIDTSALERSIELFALPELAGWFLDPEALQSDAVALLQTRESRLVVSDQIKAEREAAIVDAVVEREFHASARRRWARRLAEMALIFRATGRPDQAPLAEAAARALLDDSRDPRRHPFARRLAQRGLEVAGEVTLGRASLDDVSRKPGAAPAKPDA
jgi:hypothetical protein